MKYRVCYYTERDRSPVASLDITHEERDMSKIRLWRVAAAAFVSSAALAQADDWTMRLTCDNQFDLYFGDPLVTTSHEGFGNAWTTTYSFTATGRLPSDYIYVATSSDQQVAQGLIGEFTNTTQGRTSLTGDSEWQVFPAGAYAAALGLPSPWPASLQPTRAQVDRAITYATLNGLWMATDTSPGGALNGVSPWGLRPGISASAEWIWHRAPGGPADPLRGGFNHDEFLVFRLSGNVPAPMTAGMLGGGLVLMGRRRRA